MLSEFHRVLWACPCPKLGYVLTAAEEAEGYGTVTATRATDLPSPRRSPQPQPAEQPQPLNGGEVAPTRRQSTR